MGDTKIDVQLEGLTPNERAFMAQVRAMPEVCSLSPQKTTAGLNESA